LENIIPKIFSIVTKLLNIGKEYLIENILLQIYEKKTTENINLYYFAVT